MEQTTTLTSSAPVGTKRVRRKKSYPEALLTTHYTDIQKVTRPIDLIVIHCSATRENRIYTPGQLISDHMGRGFLHAGYHFYIPRNGDLYTMRPLSIEGAHVAGHNDRSIGICYEGGLDADGKAADTRTPAQRIMMAQLVMRLRELWPKAKVCGHRDLSRDLNGDGKISRDEWVKMCPCFDAKTL